MRWISTVEGAPYFPQLKGSLEGSDLQTPSINCRSWWYWGAILLESCINDVLSALLIFCIGLDLGNLQHGGAVLSSMDQLNCPAQILQVIDPA
jgi:hypothetical protein